MWAALGRHIARNSTTYILIGVAGLALLVYFVILPLLKKANLSARARSMPEPTPQDRVNARWLYGEMHGIGDLWTDEDGIVEMIRSYGAYPAYATLWRAYYELIPNQPNDLTADLEDELPASKISVIAGIIYP